MSRPIELTDEEARVALIHLRAVLDGWGTSPIETAAAQRAAERERETLRRAVDKLRDRVAGRSGKT